MFSNHLTANRAMTAFRTAGTLAGSGNSRINDYGVVQFGDDIFLCKYLAADRAVAPFRSAGSFTRCGNTGIHDNGVVELICCALCRDYRIANGAVTAFGQAGGRAGSCDGCICNGGVAECGNGFREENSTAGAYVILAALIYAVGLFGNDPTYVGSFVILCRKGCGFRFGTGRAGANLFTFCVTGGRSCYRPFSPHVCTVRCGFTGNGGVRRNAVIIMTPGRKQ